MKKLIFTLLVFSFLFSQHVCDPTTGIEGGFWRDLVVALLSITIFLIGVFYMLGNVFHDARLIVFAKEELSALIFTVFIFVGMQSLFVGSCAFFSSYLSIYNVENQIEFSKNFLNDMQVSLQNIIKGLYEGYFEHRIQSTVNLARYDFSGQGAGFNVNAWRGTIATQMEILINMLSVLLISAKMQYVVFDLFLHKLIPLTVPVAIILRMFPKTREGGDILLSIVFSFYIVLPVVYTIFALSYYTININQDCASSVGKDPFFGCDAGNGLINFVKFFPYTVLFPNIALAITISTIMAGKKILSFAGEQI